MSSAKVVELKEVSSFKFEKDSVMATKVVTPDESTVAIEVPVEATRELVSVSGVAAEAAGTLSFTKIDASLEGSARQDAIRSLLKNSTQAAGLVELAQGELLYETKQNGYWSHWLDDDGNPYTAFDHYVENELGVKPKTAFNRIATYAALVVTCKLTAADLVGVPLSKIPFITKHLTPETAPSILKAVQDLSFRQMAEFSKSLTESASVEDAVALITASKAAKLAGPASGATSADVATPAPAGAGAKEAGDSIGTLSVKMPKGQLDTIKMAIGVAKAATGTESDGAALEAICLSFMVSAPSSALSDDEKIAQVAMLIGSIQSAYGVELQVVSA